MLKKHAVSKTLKILIVKNQHSNIIFMRTLKKELLKFLVL